MAKAVMMVYGIDQIDQVVREAARRGNRSGFGQPSSCNSPRVAPGARHDPSPWRSASRLHSTVPAVTTQSGAVAHPECPGQSELPHVALQEGAARPAAGRSASAPPQKRRGRPPKAGGEFFCPRCNESRGSLETLNNSHFKCRRRSATSAASRRRQPVAGRGRAVGCHVDDRGCRPSATQSGAAG